MSTYRIPHIDDLTTNAKLPGQLTENFRIIQEALLKIDKLSDEQAKFLASMGLTEDDLDTSSNT